MKKLLNILALTISVAFAQDAASVASVQFSGEGLSDLETKTLYNYFMGELEKASDGPLLAQETVDQSVNEESSMTNSKEIAQSFISKIILATTDDNGLNSNFTDRFQSALLATVDYSQGVSASSSTSSSATTLNSASEFESELLARLTSEDSGSSFSSSSSGSSFVSGESGSGLSSASSIALALIYNNGSGSSSSSSSSCL